ncbi:MAG TPA: hypothetical protein VF815_35030 [Myxococcaceae bacterium]|jgi:hypothetical protein
MNQTDPGNTKLSLTLTEVEQRINTLVRQGSIDTHEIGRLYNYVVENKLAKKPLYKDAKDFFRKRIKGLSQSVLSLYGTVADQFTAEVCGQYGMNNLYFLYSYQKATRIPVDVNNPGPTLIEVPQEEGEPVLKPFAECNVEELKLAAQYKRAQPTPSLPTPDMGRIERYNSTLARFFPDNKLVRVTGRIHGDKLLLSLKDIPEGELEQLAEALLECLDPALKAA